MARVDARFDAAIALLDHEGAGSVAGDLARAQDAALVALGNAANALASDPHLAGAQDSFVRLRTAIEGLVPPTLPRTGPLTADAVIAACEHWRPSLRVAAAR